MPRKPNPELIDDENPEWTEADLARMRPAADVLREQLGASAERLLTRKRRGPAKAALRQRRKTVRSKRRAARA